MNLYLPLLDFTGNDRIYGGRIDMGALEWQGYAVEDEMQIKSIITAYPNPFSTSTTISYAPANLRESTRIKIYNIKGQLVRTLNVSSFPNPTLGMCEVVWDGTDEDGIDLQSGVYLYRLGESNHITGKVIKTR
ncbi:MAG: T9SS type A sorting domain-containing protein [Candidatus Cloacimonetes bacterium]|nr:T9SS type A sorting domain-containing protein [Candidatus Cloacimonadota bacterium]